MKRHIRTVFRRTMTMLARLWLLLRRTEVVLPLLYYGIGIVYYLTMLAHHQM